MKNSKPFSSEEFKEIYSKVPRLCVDLVIKIPEGIVLSLRSIPPYKGSWHFPGGTVLFREKVKDAIQRVAMEEIGISVKIHKFLGYIEFFDEEKERGFGYSVSMAFLCHLAGTDIRPNSDASEIKTFKELPDNMVDEQRVFLESVWREIME